MRSRSAGIPLIDIPALLLSHSLKGKGRSYWNHKHVVFRERYRGRRTDSRGRCFLLSFYYGLERNASDGRILYGNDVDAIKGLDDKYGGYLPLESEEKFQKNYRHHTDFDWPHA